MYSASVHFGLMHCKSLSSVQRRLIEKCCIQIHIWQQVIVGLGDGVVPNERQRIV